MRASIYYFFFVLLMSLNSRIVKYSVVVVNLLFEIDIFLQNFKSRFFFIILLEVEIRLKLILLQFWIDWRFSFFLSFQLPFIKSFWNSDCMVRNPPKKLIFFDKIVNLCLASLVIFVRLQIKDILVLLVLFHLVFGVFQIVHFSVAVEDTNITHNLTFAYFFELHMKDSLLIFNI